MAMTSIVPGGGGGGNEFTTTTSTTTSKFSFLKDINTAKSNNSHTPLPGSNNNSNNNNNNNVVGPSPGHRNPASKSGTFHGRKFIEVDKSTTIGGVGGGGGDINDNNTISSSRIRGKKMNSNLNDLDKLLDNDAVALLNMRKDLSHAQEQEVEKARIVLTNLQKECDSLKILNLQKEHEVNKYEDQKKVLLTLVKSQNENSGKYTHSIESLNEEIAQVEDNISAENRTKTVLLFMIKRLEDEIIECKSNSHRWTQLLQQTKAELNGIDSTLRLSKHELSNDEKQVEVLSKTIKGRNEQRIHKMNELQSLVLEGESSVMKIKQTLKGSLDTMPSTRKHDDFEHFPKTEIQKSHDAQDVPSTATNTLEEYELTKEQIHEIIERYNSRLQLIDKLNSIQNDLNGQIRDQKQKKINFDDLLEKSNQKLQLLASNRQIYQEVDMKDAALSTARKEGDDCRERDQRLRKGIEGLRRSIPRFLQKVNKDLIPDGGKPVTVDQLPDVVHKLDDEINKLIKLISERMMKDATPEDISNMSNSVQEYNNMQTTETTLSETSRLHKLPGYHRLQKQLFYNLMSAVPDSSEKNIRVQTIGVIDNNADDHPRGINGTQDGNNISGENKRLGNGVNNINGGNINNNNNNNNINNINNNNYLSNDISTIGGGNDYIDRATIKNISKLVVTQKEKHLQQNHNFNHSGGGYKRFGNTRSR